MITIWHCLNWICRLLNWLRGKKCFKASQTISLNQKSILEIFYKFIVIKAHINFTIIVLGFQAITNVVQVFHWSECTLFAFSILPFHPPPQSYQHVFPLLLVLLLLGEKTKSLSTFIGKPEGNHIRKQTFFLTLSNSYSFPFMNF